MTPADLLPLPKGTLVYFLDKYGPSPYYYEGPSSYQYAGDEPGTEPRKYILTAQSNGHTVSLYTVQLSEVFATQREARQYLIDCLKDDVKHQTKLLEELEETT